MKKIIITLSIILGITLSVSAQEGGLFGKGPSRGYDNDYYDNDYDRTTGLLSLPSSHGETNDQNASLGSGALLLIGFGAVYAFKKRRN